MQIRLEFEDITNKHQDLVLHKIPRPVIEHDILLYFQDKFSQLRRERSFPLLDWPRDKNIKILVKIAMPLFILVTTVYQFISKSWNPEKCLKAILTDQATYVSKIDNIYMPVLNQLLTG